MGLVSMVSLIHDLPVLYTTYCIMMPPCGLCPASFYLVYRVPSYPTFQASILDCDHGEVGPSALLVSGWWLGVMKQKE